MAHRGWQFQRHLSKARKRVGSKLSSDAAWQVTLDQGWLCPYCGEIGVVDLNQQKDAKEAVCIHLVETCPLCNDFEGSVLTVAQLSAIAHQKMVKKRMLSDKAWLLRDSEGRWLCPYCATATKIRIPKKGLLTKDLLDKILNHLHFCYSFDEGKGEPRDFAYLKRQMSERNRVNKLTGEIAQKMASDKKWTNMASNGSWACPFCKTIIIGINISSELVRTRTAPGQIAAHLLTKCSKYKEGSEPMVSVDEMKDVTKAKVVMPSRTMMGKKSGQEDNWRKDIEKELKVVTEQIRTSRDLEQSLEEARRKQLRMLPETPVIEGFEFACIYEPSAKVSGDFYDFIPVSDNEIGIVIGDVSGHGVDAALIMGMARKIINLHARGSSSPAETLKIANADLLPDLDERTFITGFYGLLNWEAKTLRFCRAGMNPLVLYNANRTDNPLQILEPDGMVLGMDAGKNFNDLLQEMEIALLPGDMLVGFTDGLCEAKSPSGEELGFERSYRMIEEYGQHEAKYLLHMMLVGMREFTQSSDQEDDITVLAIKVK